MHLFWFCRGCGEHDEPKPTQNVLDTSRGREREKEMRTIKDHLLDSRNELHNVKSILETHSNAMKFCYIFKESRINCP